LQGLFGLLGIVRVREIADPHRPELGLRVAEHPLERRVALVRPTLYVGEDDANRRVLEQRAKLRLFLQ
jgi:hypothetical protein